MFHNEFFPTPESTLELMGIECEGKIVLDPSAGSGNILDFALKYGAKKTLAFEITENLQRIVKDKHELIGSDFFEAKEDELSHIDMIIMNPPFSNADKHILKAWEVAGDGCEIIAICNENTLSNGYSRIRSQLISLIRDYGTSESLGQTFQDAERKTDVSISLIKLFKPKKENNFDYSDYFIDEQEVEERQEDGIQRYDEVKALVNRYVGAIKNFDSMFSQLEMLNNATSQLGLSKLELEISGNKRIMDRETFSKHLQKESWKFIFRKMNLEKYLTSGVMKDINKFVEKQQNFPFTMKNIYKMFDIIVGTREQTFNRALEEAIDSITMHTHENRYNVEGWKTNSGYMLNKKFIQERVVSNEWGYLKVSWDSYSSKRIEDLTKVLCSLTGKNFNKLIEKTIITKEGEEKKIYTSADMYSCFQGEKLETNTWYSYGFFDIKFYKKGTAHLKFKDENDWFRINQQYGKLKGFVLKEK